MVQRLIGGDEKGAWGGKSMCIREWRRDKERKKMKEREWGKREREMGDEDEGEKTNGK